MPDHVYQPPLPQGSLKEGQVILRDGSTAELKPAWQIDPLLVLGFLTAVSLETRKQRFFAEVTPQQGAKQLLKLNTLENSLSLFVLLGGPDKPHIIAHGQYIQSEVDPEAAEVAFIVADEFQGKGLGTLLLERLALVAVRQGISRFYAPTEAKNRQMRGLFKRSGFPVKEDSAGGYVDVSFSILPNQQSVERFELRERIATIASLRPFFKPRSVAIIGASRNPESIGHRILTYLVLNRFNGPVYPINPQAKVVASMPAYASVNDIDEPIDLAIIAVPQARVMSVVDECGQKGVRSLVVISAGFAETGNKGLEAQKALLAKARGYGMRLVGPNCLGLLNTAPEVKLNASFSPVFPPHGPLAMSSQSGALGLAVLELAETLGLGLSSFVSLGNKADVSANDLIQYWEDDPNTGVILLYLESFGNPRRFARLARRVGRKKPILAVKAGRSQAGSKAASSHTAALAASETAVDALFDQTGIIRAETLEEMFDIAALLAGQGLPKGPNVAVLTNAGGPAILAVDALAAEHLEIVEPGQGLKQALRAILPPAASLDNPIDMLASADAEQYKEALKQLLLDPSYHAVLVIFIPVGLVETQSIATAICEAVEAVRLKGIDKPVLTCFMASQGLSQALTVAKEHIPSYRFPEAAARALGKVYTYAKWRQTALGSIPKHDDIEIEKARLICQEKQKAGGGWLLPDDVSAVLSAFKLPILEGYVAKDLSELKELAKKTSYPVALKLVSKTLVHKSEWEGVRLNLENERDLELAYKAMRKNLEEANKLALLDGFLLQPMVEQGVELVIGMTDDPVFGPLMVFGLGGIHVEVLRDVVFRITPLTTRDVEDMIQGIRGYPLLEGYRGAPKADIAAIKDILLRVSRLVEEIPTIVELDLNPLKAHEPGKGCTILDARICISD